MMPRKRLIFLSLAVVALGLISGCATVPNISRDECLEKGYVWNPSKNRCEGEQPQVHDGLNGLGQFLNAIMSNAK